MSQAPSCLTGTETSLLPGHPLSCGLTLPWHTHRFRALDTPTWDLVQEGAAEGPSGSQTKAASAVRPCDPGAEVIKGQIS